MLETAAGSCKPLDKSMHPLLCRTWLPAQTSSEVADDEFHDDELLMITPLQGRGVTNLMAGIWRGSDSELLQFKQSNWVGLFL